MKHELVATQTNELAESTGKNNIIEVASNRAIAEVKGAMILAREFPRDEAKAETKIINAFSRIGLAEKAVYSYPRGGQQITGLTVKALEAISTRWGNLQSGFNILSTNPRESIVECFAWDVENNVKASRTITVQHVRQVGGNVKRLTDPRDVYEMIANQSQRRKRACLEAIIPQDIRDIARETADKAMNTSVDMSDERIKAMLEWFAGRGVTRKMIEGRMGRSIESLDPPQFVQLRKICTSITEGMSKVEDWFEVDEEEEKKQNQGVKGAEEDLKKTRKKEKSSVSNPYEEYFAAANKKGVSRDQFDNMCGEAINANMPIEQFAKAVSESQDTADIGGAVYDWCSSGK